MLFDEAPESRRSGATGTPLEPPVSRWHQRDFNRTMPMNKGQLIDSLADRSGLPRPKAAAIVNALFDTEAGIIANELRGGGRIDLPGFGRFATRERAARTGRDPRTGKDIDIPARRACVFTPRKGLRSSMKDMIGA